MRIFTAGSSGAFPARLGCVGSVTPFAPAPLDSALRSAARGVGISVVAITVRLNTPSIGGNGQWTILTTITSTYKLYHYNGTLSSRFLDLDAEAQPKNA